MLEVEDGGPEISGTLAYNEGLFSEETISRMAAHLLVLLSSIVTDARLPISRLTFIQASERELVCPNAWLTSDSVSAACLPARCRNGHYGIL